jgi:hypothetical protein
MLIMLCSNFSNSNTRGVTGRAQGGPNQRHRAAHVRAPAGRAVTAFAPWSAARPAAAADALGSMAMSTPVRWGRCAMADARRGGCGSARRGERESCGQTWERWPTVAGGEKGTGSDDRPRGGGGSGCREGWRRLQGGVVALVPRRIVKPQP